jgi:epoxyqueuosine reductase QueG
MKCVQACPVGALDGRDYPEGRTDKAACTENSADLARRRISPCGICIAVCPVGEDRRHYTPAGGEDPRHRQAREHVRRYGGL